METIETKLELLKDELSTLGIFSKCYGRATKFRQKTTSQKVRISPSVLLSGNELKIVTPDDSEKGVSFFYVKSPANYVSYSPIGNSEMKFTVDLILWFNSIKIEGWTGIEDSLNLVKQIIAQHPSFSLVQVTYEPEQIYEGFSLEEVDVQYFCHPYYGAKMTLSVNFFDNVC